MTPSQLAALTVQTNLLDPTDIAKLLQYVCLPASDRDLVKLEYNTNPRANSPMVPAASTSNDIASQLKSSPSPKLTNVQETNTTLSTSTKISTLQETTSTSASSSSTNMTTPHALFSTPSRSPKAKKRRISTAVTEIDNPGQDSQVSLITDVTETSITSPSYIEEPGAEANASDSEGELFIVVRVISDKRAQSWEDLFRRHTVKVDDKVSVLRFEKAVVEQNYRIKELKNCTSLTVDAKLEFLETVDKDPEPSIFRAFVSQFDPVRYILVTRDLTKMICTENIWSMGLDILLKFNGVTFLKVQHANMEDKDTLVLNYIADSLKVLENRELYPSNLAISNSEFSLTPFDQGQRAQKIEKLVLYRVWGHFTLEEILEKCPMLAELRVWKYLPVTWFKEPKKLIDPLTLNLALNAFPFPASKTLKNLSLHRTQLKFSGQYHSFFPCLEELWLEECVAFLKIDEIFPEVFPNLRKLGIRETEDKTDKRNCVDMATSRLLNCVVTQIPTIEWVRIKGMKWNRKKLGKGAEDIDEKLSRFLAESAGLPGCPKNFVIEKEAGDWKGTVLDPSLLEEQEDNMEYEWYELSNFFDSCENYEDYFLQDDDFPRSQLRY